MERDSLDEKLKKTLGSFESPVDIDDLWSAIEPELPPEKKRRIPFFWFFIGGLSSLFLIFGLRSGTPFLPTDLVKKETISFLQESNTNQLENKPILEVPKKQSTITQHENRSVPLIAVKERNSYEDSSIMALAKESRLIVSDTNTSFNTIPTTNLQLLPTEINFKDAGVEKLKEVDTIRAFEPVATLATLQPKAISYDWPSPMLSLPIIPQKKFTKGRWEIDLEQMIGLPKSVYRATNPEFEENIATKANSEQPLWMLGSSFNIGYRAFKQLRVKLGLSVLWTYERFAHSYSADSLVQREVPTSFYVKSAQDTVFYNESLALKRTIHQEIIHYNRNRLINIPLGLSYQFNLIGQRMEVGAGTLLNLNIESEGRILDGAGELSELSTENNTTNFQLAYYAEFGLILAPQRRMNYLFKVHSSYFPNNFNQVDDRFRQDYFLFGLKAGLRYRF